MFNWLFRRKEEVPTEVDYNPPIINEINPFNPIGYDGGIDPLFRVYSDKGISRSASKKNPYRATLTINTKNKKSEPIYHNVHIGVFATKEEAQKARWEFIENLK